MTTLHITNRTTSALNLTGDKGMPAIYVGAAGGVNTASINITDVLGNSLLCDALTSLLAADKVYIRYASSTGTLLTSYELDAFKNGTNPLDTELTEICVKIAGINLKSTTTFKSVKLPGTSLQRFSPQKYYFICRTANTLSADGTLDLGTTSTGDQVLAAQALTGLNLVNEVFRVDVAVTAAASLAGDATLYAYMHAADSGTSGTIDLIIKGVLL